MAASSGKPVALRSAIVIVLLLLGMTGAQAYLSFQTATADNFEILSQSAEALDFQLTATLRTIDELLADFSERIDPDHWPDPMLLPWLSGRLAATPAANTVLVAGLDGHSIGPGISAKQNLAISLDVGTQEYFLYHVASPADRHIHVGAPIVSRVDGQFSLPVSRGIFDRKGGLKAIVRITLDPAALIGDFAKLMAGDTASNAIFHESGTFLAGASNLDQSFSHVVDLNALGQATSGGGVAMLPGPDHRRLIAYHHIPQYHLAVVTSIRGHEAYATWRQEQLSSVAMLLLLSIAIIGFAIVFDRREREHNAAITEHQNQLERQVAERTAELRAENEIRAKTEEALRASRRRLANITDSLRYSILVYDRSGQIVFANLAARSSLGGGEMEGLPVDHFLQLEVDGEVIPFERSALSMPLKNGTSFQDDDASLRVIQTDASVPVAYVCAPLGEESQRRNVVMSFRDIADIKRAQWEVLQASRLASVGQLASGIAHEINTPIQYIGNNLSFIADSVRQVFDLLGVAQPGKLEGKAAFLAEELPAAISESLDGVAQIARIVLSMKEFSHPGSTAKTLVDLNHALDTTLTVTSNVWKHAAAIERHYEPSLPPVPCLAGEMNQVFLNLIVNAVHAIEGSGKPLPGRISLSTSARGGYAEIRIEDSGTGIPAALRDKIFDPFFTTKEVGKGTGQGLAICQDVVIGKHGGKIEVGGTEGVGAVFLIRLPFEDAGQEHVDQDSERGNSL